MKARIGNCYVDGNVAIGFCDALEETLIIPDGIVSIQENAFSEYYGLTTVEFPNSLKNIGDAAFDRCSNLRRIFLPENVTNVESTFLGGTFSECKQLVDVDLSKTKIKNLSGSMFWKCKNLQKVKLPPSLIKIGRNVFFECTNLTSLELNEGLKIIECSFADSKRLSILNIPKSVIHIEDLSYNEHIKTIVISKEQYEAFKEYLPPKCKILFKE